MSERSRALARRSPPAPTRITRGAILAAAAAVGLLAGWSTGARLAGAPRGAPWIRGEGADARLRDASRLLEHLRLLLRFSVREVLPQRAGYHLVLAPPGRGSDSPGPRTVVLRVAPGRVILAGPGSAIRTFRLGSSQDPPPTLALQTMEDGTLRVRLSGLPGLPELEATVLPLALAP